MTLLKGGFAPCIRIFRRAYVPYSRDTVATRSRHSREIVFSTNRARGTRQFFAHAQEMREKQCRDCVATVSRPCRDCVATVSRLYCDDSITKHRGVNKHDTHVRPFYLPLAFPFLYFCVFPLPLPLIMFIIIRENTPAGVGLACMYICKYACMNVCMCGICVYVCM